MHKRVSSSAARIELGFLKTMVEPSSVKRKTSADCFAQTIRVIAKRLHEVKKS
jgi:hypothetical protein